jgi:RNA-directed DNA polymerase
MAQAMEYKYTLTNIYEGFDFLGQQTRKFKNGQVLTTHSRKSMQGLQTAVRQILKELCVMEKTFSMFDTRLHFEIRRWLNRRHPNKGRFWIKKNYFRPHQTIRCPSSQIRKNLMGEKNTGI